METLYSYEGPFFHGEVAVVVVDRVVPSGWTKVGELVDGRVVCIYRRLMRPPDLDANLYRKHSTEKPGCAVCGHAAHADIDCSGGCPCPRVKP